MTECKATRTLVKSPPELWSEVSSAASLQRHMDRFGEIRITDLEPETAVAWEGEHARGTITLEPSGWGTRVSLTAEPLSPPAADEAQEEISPAGQSQAQAATEGQEVVSLAGQPQAQAATEGREVDHRGESEPPANPGTVVEVPSNGVEAEVRELDARLERNRREAEVRKRRWPRRLVEAVRRWFEPQASRGRAPIADERGHSPAAVPVAPEQPAAPVVVEPPAQVVDEPPDAVVRQERPQTAALTAALDSLGQAHHRPYSRA